MSADPVSDVMHRQRADALDASDLIFHSPMKRGEVGRPCQLASDSLKSCLDLFERAPAECAADEDDACRLAARKARPCGWLADGLRWISKNRISARVVAVFADVVADNFIERHAGCSSWVQSTRGFQRPERCVMPLSTFFQKYSACLLAAVPASAIVSTLG